MLNFQCALIHLFDSYLKYKPFLEFTKDCQIQKQHIQNLCLKIREKCNILHNITRNQSTLLRYANDVSCLVTLLSSIIVSLIKHSHKASLVISRPL